MPHSPNNSPDRGIRLHLALLLIFTGVMVWSAIKPAGRLNWFMETFPALIGGIALIATYRRMRLTTLTYTLIFLFALILAVGGHYTYANAPPGRWMSLITGRERNDFDRVGHVFQGIVPAMLARELLLRTSPLRKGKWLAVIIVCIALAISAGYELFEWQYAITFGGKQAEDFLGSQGDFWDAQQDMAMALIGAIIATLFLSHWQDAQLRGLGSFSEHSKDGETLL